MVLPFDRFQFVSRPARLVAFAVLAVLLSSQFTGIAAARGAPESFADLAQKLLPTVVNISSTTVMRGAGGTPELPQFPPGSPFEEFFRDFFERNRPQQQQRRATSLGSGFIIDPSGIIVTNNHVIQDADEITVILNDDRQFKATIVGRDQKTDLAVLKVENGGKLPSVPWGDSDGVRVGDWVVAIGNPFGLGGTVTAGIVSARGRDIRSGPYDDFIQTDASINRGNSGGPLFDMDGRVVGINTAIFSPSGGSIGIGFAIPASTARNVVDQLVKYGRTKRGWLGVRIQEVNEEIADSLGLDKPNGALVASVSENSPAEKGQIRTGDVILVFNGTEVPEMRKLPRIVADTEIGKTVPVELWRDGKRVTTSVVVEELVEEEQEVAGRGDDNGLSGRDAGEQAIEALGMTVAGISDDARKRYDLKSDIKGVVVVAVDPAGAAAEKGIRPGDVIVEVSQGEVRAPTEIKDKVEQAVKDGRKSVLILVEGQNGLRFVALRIDQG
jgi:serine protease Do